MHHHLKNPRFLFQEGFLISFSSLALFLKTTCKAFISNSEWVCRFKVERFVKMVINKEKSNWNWAFQKNPLTSIAALKSLWLFEFSRQKLIIRVYNWKLEWKFKYWKKKSKWFLAWNKTFLLIFQTLCFACVFNYSLIKSLWVDIFSSSKSALSILSDVIWCKICQISIKIYRVRDKNGTPKCFDKVDSWARGTRSSWGLWHSA